MKRAAVIAVALAVLLCGCATVPQTSALLRQAEAGTAAPLRIAGVPFFPQDPYQCGPAALATVLRYTGVDVVPDALVPLVYVPARKGSFQPELMAAARSFDRLVYTLQPALADVLTEVKAGHPVLVLQNLGLAWYPRWHFAVVKGYDLTAGNIMLNSGDREDYVVSLAVFERTWARGSHWALVIPPPGEVPATATLPDYFTAALTLEETAGAAAALQAYSAGLQRWPAASELLMARGNLHYALGDKDAASRDFLHVTTLQPDYAPAHNNLAQVYLELGQREAALQHARRAVELGGEFSATYRATLQQLQ